MPREADRIFLKLAVGQRRLTQQDADDVWEELKRLEDEGEPTKARMLCVEFGFMDQGLAKAIKQEVRAYLEQRMSEESRSQRRIAGYEILDRLGAGAMGAVFRARHIKSGEVRALKLLNPDFAMDETYVARFRQEAETAGALDHPNIVRAYDVGVAGDVHYLSMEFVDGKTVKELIEKRGTLEESVSVVIAMQVVEALEHAHASALIHRDVKPANIMIMGDGTAKLLDLGLARRTDVDLGLTAEGRAIGTPYYMAPEQALDKGIDYRADFYSLGVTLYNMVTGQKPYQAPTPVGVMNMHLKAPIPDPRELNPSVSQGLAQVIDMLMAKRPAERYQDHRAILRDLDSVNSGLMPELTPGETPRSVSVIRPRGAGESSGSRRGRGGRSSRRGAAAYEPAESRPRSWERQLDPEDEFEAAMRRQRLALGGVAALVLIGVTIFVLRSRKPVAPPPPPPQVVDADPRKELEAQASQAFDQVADGQGRERMNALLELAQRFPDTDSGEKARAEAERLLERLEADERERFSSRQAELDRMAGEGQLLEAIAGYDALMGEVEAEIRREQARARVAELRGVLSERVAALREQGEGQVAAGERLEGVAFLERELLPLLEGAERQALEQQIGTVRAEVRREEQQAAMVQRREEMLALQQARSAVQRLPGRIRDALAAGDFRGGVRLAEEAEEQFGGTQLRREVRVHVEGARAVAQLHTLAVEALQQAQQNEERVPMHTRNGQDVSGEVDEIGEDEVVFAHTRQILIPCRFSEMLQEDLLRVVRRAKGSRDLGYARGVAALKLYLGEEDAQEHVEHARSLGIDLSDLEDAVRGLNVRLPERDPDEDPGSDPGPVAIDDPDDPGREPDDGLTAEERERARYEAARRVYDNRYELFPDAEEVGYVQGIVQLLYPFSSQQRFGPSDWSLVRGRAYPTPPGQTHRYGLIMEDTGQVDFVAPIEGDFELKVVMLPQQFGNGGQFMWVLRDDDNHFILCNLGQIVLRERNRAVAIQGEPAVNAVRANQQQNFDFVRRGDMLQSKFAGQVVAQLEIPEDFDMGSARLSLQWSGAAVNLVRLEANVMPAVEWVNGRLR